MDFDKFTAMLPCDQLRELLRDGGESQQKLADRMGVSRYTVNQLVNGRRRITAEMAIRLSRVFAFRPEHWMDAQRDQDLYFATLRLNRKEYHE